MAAAVIDQSLFSGIHFAISVTLSRILPLTEFGSYSFLYAFIFFANAIHVGLVSEPATVFWVHSHVEKRDTYIGDILKLNAYFASALFVISFLSSLLISRDLTSIWQNILFTFTLSFGLSFFWLFRQISYASLAPWTAVVQTSLYGASSAFWIAVFWKFRILTPETALASLGLASISSVVFAILTYKPTLELTTPLDRALLGRFVTYGLWSTGAGLMLWAISSIYLVALPAYHDLSAVAHLRAFLNLTLPFQQLLLGLSLLALPILSRSFNDDPQNSGRGISSLVLGLSLIGSVAFALFLSIYGKLIYKTVYGPVYHGDFTLIPFGVSIPVTGALILAMRTILRARKKPGLVFAAYAASFLGVGLFAVPIGARNGAAGALVGISLMQGAVVVIMAASLFRELVLVDGAKAGQNA